MTNVRRLHQPTETEAQPVESMSGPQQSRIAHDAIRQVAVSLSRHGVPAHEICAALVSIAAAELIARQGTAATVMAIHDFADELEDLPPQSLHDLTVGGHA